MRVSAGREKPQPTTFALPASRWLPLGLKRR